MSVNTTSDSITQTETDMVAVEDTQDQTKAKTKKFKSWRKSRPFIAGLLLICAGAVIIAPAYMTLEILDILVVISTISGVSTLLIGVLLIMFGIGTWLKPATSPYLGVLSIIIGVVALPTSNFGGFVIGTLLAVVGGSLALAWEPREKTSKSKKAKKKEDEPDTDGSKIAPTSAVVAAVTISSVLAVQLAPSPAIAQEQGNIDFVGQTSEVTADEIIVSGNARVGLVDVETQQGTVRMIELSGDEVSVNNIKFGLPGQAGTSVLSTRPGTISTLKGNPAVLHTRTLTATPTVAGVETFPVTVEADGNLKEIDKQLQKLGVTSTGVPDELMDHITLKNAHLDALGVKAEVLDAPGVSLIASHN